MTIIPEYRAGLSDGSHAYAGRLRGVALLIGLVPAFCIAVLVGCAIVGVRRDDDKRQLLFLAAYSALLIAAAVLLSAYLNVRRAHPSAPRKLMATEKVVLLLLLVDLAGVIAVLPIVNYLNTLTTLTVRNDGTHTFSRFVISSGEDSVDFGPLKPGMCVSRKFHWASQPLRCERVDGNGTLIDIIEGTNTWSSDADALRSLRADGITVQVSDHGIHWK